MSTIAKVIGERLRYRRQQLGYSQEKTAEKAGLHPTYIGQLERGEKNATLESIEKVCNALDYPLENLFEKVTTTDKQNSTANRCFNLLIKQPAKDQEKIYQVLEQIIEYKNSK